MVVDAQCNVVLAISCHTVSFTYCKNTLDIPFRLLFHTTCCPDDRIYKANLDGSDVTAIVTTGLSDVRSIAINYDKKRMCWADVSKYWANVSPKCWVRYSI